MTVETAGAYPFDAFVDDLRQAGRGVVRVAIDAPTKGLCSGWLITDSLVVVPKFGLHVEDTGYSCMADGVEIAATVAHRPAGDDSYSPALLRLETSLQGQAMRLHVRRAEAGDPIVVLHYPGLVTALQLSIARVLDVENPTGSDRVIHDASTAPGSSGAPLLAASTLSVVGTHVAKRAASGDERQPPKEAIGLVTLLDELRTATCWPEIADHHRLARVDTPSSPDVEKPAAADSDLVTAALRWNVDAGGLDPGVQERLRPLVVDPDEETWSVTSGERRRLINAAGSLEAIRTMHTPTAAPTAGQRAIDRIIGGPPYDLDVEPMDELPYWLQATEWFSDVAPGLPRPAEVQRALARRRVRDRLKGVAGERLVGRKAPLGELTRWYADSSAGPLMLTGVGGVGKSALLARFALDLPPSTLLLWLDFDRPDLAAEVAESVLRSLGEQSAAQLDDFTAPAVDPSNWEAGADALAAALAARLDDAKPALLVLDGFEIAQASKRYAVVWDVLERIMARFSSVRVIVSGRAPVTDLALGGKAAQPLHLSGLTDEAAEEFLEGRGVRDAAVISTVMSAAQGIPLRLQLAVRLIQEGDTMADLETSLPHAMVEGYLYGRILNRVVDRRLRPLARDALVLRRLPAEMIGVVLADRLPAELDTATAFDQLSREMALVDDVEPGSAGTASAPLRMRPEVRGPLLQLLATDDAGRVREIDQRAVDWYRDRGGSADPAERAELVYHQLRLGDISAAEATWHDDCAPLLLNADADIPDEFAGAREWLLARTTGARDPAIELQVWESSTYNRIRSLLARGHPHSIRAVLDEFPDRSPGGPLIAYDAWARWALDHDLAEARRVLDNAPAGTDTFGVQRTILRAFLAAKAGDRDAAFAALSEIDRPELTTGSDGPTGQLSVQAACVRLQVDLAAELELVEELNRDRSDLATLVRGFLTSADVVLPSLARALSDFTPESFVSGVDVPKTDDEMPDFAETRNRLQYRDIPGTRWPSLDEALRAFIADYPEKSDSLQQFEAVSRDLAGKLARAQQRGFGLALDLFLRARRRWRIADSTLLLAGLAAALKTQPFTYQMQIALASTLAAFRGQPLRTEDGELEQLMAAALQDVAPGVWLRAPDPDDDLTGNILALERLPDVPPARLPESGWSTGTNALYFYLCGPDPLSVLCQRALGFNELGD